MKVMALLLASAVALLVSSAVAAPAAGPTAAASENLNEIINITHKYNKSLSQELFVEDVESLFNHGCNERFFCKVHDILVKHEHFGKKKNKDEEKIVRNLESFTRPLNPNCTVLLKHSPQSVSDMRPIPYLLDYLVKCIKRRNLNGGN